jgi:hypothetical protein
MVFYSPTVLKVFSKILLLLVTPREGFESLHILKNVRFSCFEFQSSIIVFLNLRFLFYLAHSVTTN